MLVSFSLCYTVCSCNYSMVYMTIFLISHVIVDQTTLCMLAARAYFCFIFCGMKCYVLIQCLLAFSDEH